MLTRCLAIDYGRWHIRVNSLNPGPVNTPALQRELQRLKVSLTEFEEQVFQRQCLPFILQAPSHHQRDIRIAVGDWGFSHFSAVPLLFTSSDPSSIRITDKPSAGFPSSISRGARRVHRHP
jgi:NAD(P)-dependent dehydrogenase (short-subunit alcohol dehydrogenase family)